MVDKYSLTNIKYNIYMKVEPREKRAPIRLKNEYIFQVKKNVQ